MSRISKLQHITEDMLRQLKTFKPETDVVSAGQVVSSNDGVIYIDGMTSVQNGELLFIPEYNFAIAMNLEEDGIGAILLTDGEVASGDIVYTTGKIVSTPVGRELLGRVVNPLGQPLDGKGKIHVAYERSIEAKAPGIYDRGKVSEPLYTGITAIDAMVPIGKGQRELILGDRQTGKTALAIDAIINQKDKGVLCVYVAIGQKATTVTRIIQALREHDALKHTVIVCSTADQTAPLQYLAPYTGTAIAEEFMRNGKDVLIVYDDLTKHAVAYRTISLLLRRPSGREAYPGDVFYIHSKLLERSAKLSAKHGGGSLTALPIIETLSGDISSYIPTNVISITDGQIFLESELFHAGVRPAINVGLSVSRVGGAAQVQAIRKVSGKVRLQLAHYREMLVFSQFGADLDSSTKQVIAKGERLTKVLNQSQYSPKTMTQMTIELAVCSLNLLMEVPVGEVRSTLDAFYGYLQSNNGELLARITEKGQLNDDDLEEISVAYNNFKGHKQ